MRILHVATRANVGGASRWIEALTVSATAAGHETLVAVGAVQRGEAEADTTSWPLVRIPQLGRSVSPAGDLAAIAALRHLIRDYRPDVVNTHMSKAGGLGRIASLFESADRPTMVHTFHGHVLDGYFPRAVSAGISVVERSLASVTDLLLAVGNEVTRDLVARRIAPPEKVLTVLPGLPDIGVSRVPSDGQITAGWLARMVRIKRPDRLVGAARCTPEVSYLVGGDGPLRAGLEERAPTNIQTLGRVEPSDFWSRCDMAVLTSDNEGVPTALVEAALAGIPAVATKAGSVTDAVVDGETGLIVEKSAGAVAEAIRFLADDPDARLRMGAAARERALVEFSPERMWQRHEQAYERALENRWRKSRSR